MKLQDLKIDPEFAEKIPPLTKEEYEQLEANILADQKVINPLIVWNNVIVDGHNRYRILQTHPKLPFQVHNKEFSDRYEAIAWICRHQLGCRNLTPAQKKYLVGKQYEAEKAMLGGKRDNQRDDNGRFTAMGQNDPLRSDRTSARIAKEIGKGERYVRRAEEYAKGLDVAEKVLPGVKQMVFSGEIRPPDKDVVAVARAPDEEKREMAKRLKLPRSSIKNGAASIWESDTEEDVEDDDELPEVFKPNTAAIRKISEEMESTPERPAANVDTEFIILELGNALESMMYRWETCITDYRKEAMAKDCQKKIKELVLEGIRYLQQYKGGVKNAVV